MQITAVYTGYEFRVHKAGCPDIGLIGEPDVHERLHLTATSQAEAVRRVWADALSVIKRAKDTTTYADLTKFLPCCAALPEAETPYDEGIPYFEIYAASPGGYDAKKYPTAVVQSLAEHNARKYSRDGRAYVVEHADTDGKRSKVAVFRNGRKVRHS